MADGKFNLFGRSYEFVGREGADFCIKTKGKVKVKWGNKYIDLIKDGKINVDSEFIKKADSVDDIGNADGIYVTNDGEIYIVFNGQQYPIFGNEATSSYVAYVLQEGKTGEERQYALMNIGSVFNTAEEYAASGIQNGIAYIIEETSIYMMQNGSPTKLEFKIPNPVTEPITVNIQSGDYSLLLNGYYSENHNRFYVGKIGSSISIYAESDFKYIEADTPIAFIVKGNKIITVDSASLNVSGDVVVSDGFKVESNKINSIGGNEDDGFLLIEEGGESTLYVDNIVERNNEDDAEPVTSSDFFDLVNEGQLEPGRLYEIEFQNEWDCTEKRLEDTYDDVSGDAEDDEGNPDFEISGFLPKNVFHLMIRATTINTFEPFGYFKENKNWIIRYENIEIDTGITVEYEDEEDNVEKELLITHGRIVYMRDEFGNEANYDFKHLQFFNEETGSWDYTFRYRNNANSINGFVIGDGSTTGEIRDNFITVDFEKLKREDFPNRAYTLGGDGIVKIDGKPVKNTIGTISGSFTLKTGISDDEEIRPFHDNVFNCGEMVDVVIESDFYNNNIETTEGFEVKANSGFFNNTVACKSIDVKGSEVSFNKFYGGGIVIEMTGEVTHNTVNGEFITANGNEFSYNTVYGEISNCTLAPSMKYCHFKGDINGQDFTDAGNNIFGSDKHIDIYVNDGELRTICMPDTVFPGMIVMYDGRKPVPTGWAMCDGNNGTPNLIDKYIKASTEAGLEGGNENNEVTLTVDQMPAHTHTVDIPESGTGSGGGETQTVIQNVARASVTTGETGGGQPVNIEPQYYTLIFIMYVGYSDFYY